MTGLKFDYDGGFGKQPSRRPARVADAIHRELAALFLAGVKDPRLHGLTVTAVTVTKDLRIAKIYYACDEATAKDVQQGLQHAQGYLRSHLAGVLELRYAPQLQFHRDRSAEQIEAIDRLLREE
ncbi:MAG: 30S ribosome-binding factor RbfA [Thermodesulfobacteriota bacterium]